MLKDTPDRENPFSNNRPGPKWFNGFLKRHKDISVRVPERVSKARAGITEKAIRDWFEEAKTNLSKMNALHILEDPNRVFNTDESCIQLAPKDRLFWELHCGKTSTK